MNISYGTWRRLHDWIIHLFVTTLAFNFEHKLLCNKLSLQVSSYSISLSKQQFQLELQHLLHGSCLGSNYHFSLSSLLQFVLEIYFNNKCNSCVCVFVYLSLSLLSPYVCFYLCLSLSVSLPLTNPSSFNPFKNLFFQTLRPHGYEGDFVNEFNVSWCFWAISSLILSLSLFSIFFTFRTSFITTHKSFSPWHSGFSFLISLSGSSNATDAYNDLPAFDAHFYLFSE